MISGQYVRYNKTITEERTGECRPAAGKGCMNLKKKGLALCAAVMALVLTACTALGSSKLSFGAAGVGGTYYSLAQSLADEAKDGLGRTIEVKTTAGSAANLRLLSENYLQLAIAQADLIGDAYNGAGIFDGEARQGFLAVASLYAEACQVVVRADSGITGIEQLQGKIVSVGEEESGTEQNAKQILSAYGLSEKLTEQVNMNYTEAAAALADGSIDAVFCTIAVPTDVLSELSESCSVRFLPVEGSAADRLISSYPTYVPCVIPAGTYAGQTEEIETVGVRAVLLARKDVPESTVRALTELLFEKRAELQQEGLPQLADEAEAVQGVSIPFHPGAADYYAGCGLTVSTEQ